MNCVRGKYCFSFPSENISKIIPISLLLVSENQMLDTIENKHLFLHDRREQVVSKELILGTEIVRLVHDRGYPRIYCETVVLGFIVHWSSAVSERMPACAWPWLPYRPAPWSQGTRSGDWKPSPHPFGLDLLNPIAWKSCVTGTLRLCTASPGPYI